MYFSVEKSDKCLKIQYMKKFFRLELKNPPNFADLQFPTDLFVKRYGIPFIILFLIDAPRSLMFERRIPPLLWCYICQN